MGYVSGLTFGGFFLGALWHDRGTLDGVKKIEGNKVKLLMQAPPTDPRTMPANKYMGQSTNPP